MLPTVGPAQVDVGPGDLLLIPHHWWHHVESLTPTAGDELVKRLAVAVGAGGVWEVGSGVWQGE